MLPPTGPSVQAVWCARRAAKWLRENPADAVVYAVTVAECLYALAVIVAVLVSVPRF